MTPVHPTSSSSTIPPPAVPSSPPPPIMNRASALFILVQVGILLSQFWKLEFFRFAWFVYRQSNLDAGFFPPVMQSANVMATLFIAVALSTVIAMVLPSFRLPATMVQCIACGGLCLHQMTYNDATFTTMWWTSLWSVWLANRLRVPTHQAAIVRRAAFLSRCIVSMILFGGAAGKWTADYWSGEVLYDIYFIDRDFWTFNSLRSWYDADTQRWIAIWYSRMVVTTETIFGATLWLMPPRFAAVAGMLLLASIAIFSNFLLFSVMSCLIGLMSAGLFLSPTQTKST